VPKPVALTPTVTGPASYKLSVNGKEVPVRNGRATLPPDQELALEFSAQGFQTERRTLTLRPGRPQALAVQLDPLPVPKPGQPWRIADPAIAFSPILPGSFVMGSTKGSNEELPLTEVKLSQPFWLGQTEVTQSQWLAIMGSRLPADFKGGDQPAQNVTWLEATEFCRRLTERERNAERLPAGYAYVLPTEAQWEYACRAGRTEDLPSPIDKFAWHTGNSDEEPQLVATKQPNGWGLYDMHGNVWEWCSDWFAEKLPGRPVTDPAGPATGQLRVRRSGSCLLDAHHLRASIRGVGAPNLRKPNIGFRIALVPVTPTAPASTATKAKSPQR
jgi:formylglycine-generating enzyme required for sulfatase activity